MAHEPDPPGPRDPDDDLLDGEVPEPDAPPSASERAHARGFGDLVDKVLAGRAPAALPADDRALLEVATAIRAATRPVELAPPRRAALVEDALALAIERRAGGEPAATPAPPVVDLAARRAGRRRVLPWAVAAATSVIAAAAVLVLVVGRERATAPNAPATAELTPAHQRSRPSDRLIGRISRERAGEAAARLDVIYADRMAGYREGALTRPRAARGGAR